MISFYLKAVFESFDNNRVAYILKPDESDVDLRTEARKIALSAILKPLINIFTNKGYGIGSVVLSKNVHQKRVQSLVGSNLFDAT